MRKIISIALFGNPDAKDGSGMNYAAYLSTFALAHNNLFQKADRWELFLHVDDLTAELSAKVKRMHDAGLLTACKMATAPLTKAMMWRMWAVCNPLSRADYVFPRDIDSLPTPRDRKVCDQFIASGCTVGTVHDSQSHAGIMGGLCAFDAPKFREATNFNKLEDLYAFADKTDDEWAQHGTDQHVLNRLIDRAGPLRVNAPPLTLLEHRYNGWHAGPGKFAPRAAGSYRCKALSTPVPNEGKAMLSTELRREADLLVNHLGAAGYELEHARGWWEKNGDPEVTRRVRECE